MTQLQHASPAKTWGDWFDRRADHYDDPRMQMGYYVAGEPVPHSVMQATIQDVRSKLGASSTDRLLDVGGGVGLFADAFRECVADVVVTDLAPAMLRSLQRRRTASHVAVCEAAALPFASASFDRVLCYSVFHYFDGPAEAMRVLDELTRVTVPGGVVLVGDVPRSIRPVARHVETKSCSVNSTRRAPISYPEGLRHDLSPATYDAELFHEYARQHGHRCTILAQDIPGKVSSSARFDVRIVKDGP